MRNRPDGFTLVELMVAVLVIGILVAVAVPVFRAAKANAERSTCYANQRAIDGAAEAWLAENLGKTVYDVQAGSLSDVASSGSPIRGYFKHEPRCPSVDPSKFHYIASVAYSPRNRTRMLYPMYPGWTQTYGGCYIHYYYAGSGTWDQLETKAGTSEADWPAGERPANPWQ